MLSLILAALGLCLGSFVNALVWRLHEQSLTKDSKARARLSITTGRSMCVHCRHELAWYDLLPLVSWLYLRGKCRYCGQKISWQYPLVELAGALIFAVSYIFWPASLDPTGNLVLFITWLVCAVGLLALAIYDLKWMLLPSKIIYPTFLAALVGQLVYVIGFAPHKLNFILTWLGAMAVASGVFWLLFMVSGGKWIGYGDVRLGLITGTLVHTPAKSSLMIFLASLLGSAVAIPLLSNGKKTLTAKLPFGPFLISSTLICVLAGDNLINWYENLFSH